MDLNDRREIEAYDRSPHVKYAEETFLDNGVKKGLRRMGV